MIAAKHFFAYLPSDEPDPMRTAQFSSAFQRIGYRTLERSVLVGFVPLGPKENLLQQEVAILHVVPGTEIRIRSELD